MTTPRGLLTLALVSALASGCAAGQSAPPGMRVWSPRSHELDARLVELARAEPATGERALLVAYPRSACSGSASAVIVDPRGRYLGAVAPGTASLVTVPADGSILTLFSSVELTAALGDWHAARQVLAPAPPGGLLLSSWRWNARECGTGSYFDVTLATKETLEDELADLRWMVPVHAEGQVWLDAHRPRLREVLETPPRWPLGDITHLVYR